ncbi:VCBS repeat-containing protein [bacterium]|nr:VCBS repeat-containing protein [bacterium]
MKSLFIKTFFALIFGFFSQVLLAQEFFVTSYKPVDFSFKNESVTVSFSQKIDQVTIKNENFLVLENSKEVKGSFVFDKNRETVTFQPEENFSEGSKITCILTNGIKSQSNQNLQSKIWEFVVRTPQTFAEPDSELVIYSTDLDFDGNLDIILGDPSVFFGNILVFWGLGKDSFSVPLRLSFPDEPFKIFAANLDKTPFAEIIVTGKEFGKIAIFQNNYDFFSEPQVFKGLEFGIVYAQDLEKDGDFDLVLTSAVSNSNVKILLNDGKGKFLANDLEAEKIISAYAGDLNGDKIPDLVGIAEGNEKFLELRLSNQQNSYTSSKLRIGNFTKITVNDFNKDGFADIFLSGETPKDFVILENSGNGNFNFSDLEFSQIQTGEWQTNEKSIFKIFDFGKDNYLPIVVNFTSENLKAEIFDFGGKKLQEIVKSGKIGESIVLEEIRETQSKVFMKLGGAVFK